MKLERKASLKRAHGSSKHPKSAQGALPNTPHVSTATVMWRYKNEVVRTPPCSLFRFGAPKHHSAFGEPFKEGLHSSTCYITYLWQGLRWTSAFTSKLRKAVVVTGHTRSVSHTFSSFLGNRLIIIFLPHFSHLFSITTHWLMSDHKLRYFSRFYVHVLFQIL